METRQSCTTNVYESYPRPYTWKHTVTQLLLPFEIYIVHPSGTAYSLVLELSNDSVGSLNPVLVTLYRIKDLATPEHFSSTKKILYI